MSEDVVQAPRFGLVVISQPDGPKRDLATIRTRWLAYRGLVYRVGGLKSEARLEVES